MYVVYVECGTSHVLQALPSASACEITSAASAAVGVFVQFRCSGGICALRRVLRGFAAARPGVGYCQGLNFLAGTLLLFQEQELALASLLQLVVSTDKNKGRGCELEGL